MTETADQTPSIRDPEAAQLALAEVQEILARQRLESELVQREQHAVDAQRQAIVEQLVLKQHQTALQARLDQLHPADIAYILEALPREERLIIWDLVRAERDGEILVEVSDAVRETLIASMDREELVAAAETLDTDDLAALAPDLPEEVVEEVRGIYFVFNDPIEGPRAPAGNNRSHSYCHVASAGVSTAL